MREGLLNLAAGGQQKSCFGVGIFILRIQFQNALKLRYSQTILALGLIEESKIKVSG